MRFFSKPWNWIWSIGVLLVCLPSVGQAKLTCHSPIVYQAAAKSARVPTSEQMHSEPLTGFNHHKQRDYNSNWYMDGRKYWYWLAGNKVKGLFGRGASGYGNSQSVEVKLSITDRSIMGTKYTLCLVAVPSRWVRFSPKNGPWYWTGGVYASYWSPHTAKRCQKNSRNGSAWCSNLGFEWVLNSKANRKKKTTELPNYFLLGQKTIEFNGTWRLSEERKSLTLTSRVNDFLKSKLDPIKRQVDPVDWGGGAAWKAEHLIMAPLKPKNWAVVPVLIMSNTNGTVAEKLALIVSNGSVGGAIKWNR